MSEINDTEEVPEGTFPINLKLIQKYQRLETSITAKYKYVRIIRVILMEVVIFILNL